MLVKKKQYPLQHNSSNLEGMQLKDTILIIYLVEMIKRHWFDTEACLCSFHDATSSFELKGINNSEE